MSRGFWFVAGAGVGVYAVVKARRAAETLTPEGLRDRLSALGVGAQLFAEEVRAGAAERETELRERLGMTLDGPRELESSTRPGGFETGLAGPPQPPEATGPPQPPEATGPAGPCQPPEGTSPPQPPGATGPSGAPRPPGAKTEHQEDPH